MTLTENEQLELASLRSEVETLRADAARYQWAKQNIQSDYIFGDTGLYLSDESISWDETIDFGMKLKP